MRFTMRPSLPLLNAWFFDRTRPQACPKMGLVVSCICLLLQSCAYFRSDSEQPNWQAFDQQQIQTDLQPLDLTVPYHPTEAIQEYFEYYDLDIPHATHTFGTLESEDEMLVVHVFAPPESRGSLFLLHGYFDHTGTLSKLIKAGVAQTYTVVVWDLAGHGLSSGKRTETGEFSDCAQQLDELIQQTSTQLPQPYNLIAHSTGCSIALEYMYSHPEYTFQRTVFLAPLIRHEHWTSAKFGYTLAKPFTNSLRRRDKKNSSDSAYMDFVKQDPLHSNTLSFEYLEDLYAWEKTTQDYPLWSGSLCIIQGDDDNIVDWDYNLDFLREKIQDPEIYIIPEARHQLANESEALRQQVFQLIFTYLNQP
ncbi:alpha/beta hydrolase [Kiritimatiellota bacterium B12222]|nr:alpha/beta hydrolase [Kiritimatiellota bacterium B12222]